MLGTVLVELLTGGLEEPQSTKIAAWMEERERVRERRRGKGVTWHTEKEGCRQKISTRDSKNRNGDTREMNEERERRERTVDTPTAHPSLRLMR